MQCRIIFMIIVEIVSDLPLIVWNDTYVQCMSRTRNCARLLIVATLLTVATQSSRLNCRSQLRQGHMATMYVT